jgi:HD-like signal output (HDOD) protein
VPHPERLFVAGLLHDLGSLVLYQSRADACRDHLLVAAGDEQALWQVETEAFGFSHAELGGRLLARWGLPEAITDAIACHHAPASARVAPFEAAVLHVAEALANRSGVGAFSEQAGESGQVDEDTWRTLGIRDPDALGAELLAEASEHFIETARLVCPPPAEARGAAARHG